MIVLPIYLQMVLEYNALQAGLSIAPLSLSMFGLALLAGQRAGRRRPSTIVRWGFALLTGGLLILLPIVPRADSGWYLLVPLLIAGSGLGLLVSQLNNYTLSPVSDERVSEAAGVNSAAGSFGLSFGLAFAGAIMLAALATHVHPLRRGQRRPVGRPAAAGGRGPGGRRAADEQHRARGAARRPARAGPGRDHPDQHRDPAAGPADRAADPRSSRGSWAWPTPSACHGCPTRLRPARPKAPCWADRGSGDGTLDRRARSSDNRDLARSGRAGAGLPGGRATGLAALRRPPGEANSVWQPSQRCAVQLTGRRGRGMWRIPR